MISKTSQAPVRTMKSMKYEFSKIWSNTKTSAKIKAGITQYKAIFKNPSVESSGHLKFHLSIMFPPHHPKQTLKIKKEIYYPCNGINSHSDDFACGNYEYCQLFICHKGSRCCSQYAFST